MPIIARLPYIGASAPRWPITPSASWQARDLLFWLAANAPASNDLILEPARGNHGTATAITTVGTSLGGALNFSEASASQVDYPARQYIDQNVPFTISWIARTLLTDTYPALAQFQADNRVYEVFYSKDANYDDVSFGSSGTEWARGRITFPASVSIGDVHSVALTYNGAGRGTIGNFAAYVNGQSVTINSVSSFGTLTNQNTLGKLVGLSNSSWDGQMLDVRVYAREFSQREAFEVSHLGRWQDLYRGVEPIIFLPDGAGGSTFNKTSTDALSFTDPSSETASFSGVATDAIAFTDPSSEYATLLSDITEALALTDVSSETIGGITAVVTEALAFTDASSETAVFARTCLDAIAFSDSAAIATKVIGVLVTEALAFTDVATAEGGQQEEVAAGRSGATLTLEKMRRLERLQLIQRDDEEVIAAIMELLK